MACFPRGLRERRGGGERRELEAVRGQGRQVRANGRIANPPQVKNLPHNSKKLWGLKADLVVKIGAGDHEFGVQAGGERQEGAGVFDQQ